MTAHTYYVYWLRKEDHSCLLTQGYVGVTNNPTLRFKQHRTTARSYRKKEKNHPLYNAMAKNEDAFCFDILLAGSLDYCLEIEHRLRPARRIGYNCAEGGARTFLDRLEAEPFTEDVRSKISVGVKLAYASDLTLKDRCGGSNKGRSFTKEHKTKLSTSHKGKASKWNNPKADLEVWKMADVLYLSYLENPHIGTTALGLKFELKYYKLTRILDCFKSGWNPTQCEDWKSFKQNHMR